MIFTCFVHCSLQKRKFSTIPLLVPYRPCSVVRGECPELYTLFSFSLPITDIDARPWDFQAEECTLRANIEAFNSRRYDRPQDSEFSPVDNCLQSVLGQRLDLPEDFHYSYEIWLEREVFSQPICWEELLQNH